MKIKIRLLLILLFLGFCVPIMGHGRLYSFWRFLVGNFVYYAEAQTRLSGQCNARRRAVRAIKNPEG